MDKAQKLEYQHNVENYLVKQHIYDIFEQLVKQLVVKQPDDPISYLIDHLSSPQSKKIFIIGPPGFKVREYTLPVANHYQMVAISVGDLLKKQLTKKSQLGEQIESYFKNYTIVRDDIVIKIVKKEIEGLQKKSFILTGFPRTRAQGLALQREGIFPDAFVILNLAEDKLRYYCEEKMKSQKNLDKSILNNKNAYIDIHVKDYMLNIQQIKQIYPNNYFQIDCTHLGKEQILEDIARLLKFKIKSKRPKRPAAILILGGNKNSRVNVCKKLAKRYGFALIMAREQLSEQISKSTEVGRLVLDNIKQKTLVKDSIMNGLIQSRVSQVDAQMQGFVLQGYPRTEDQAVSLKDSQLQPSLIVIIEQDNKTDAKVMKNINERYKDHIFKIEKNDKDSFSEEQIFEKICFHLENS